MARMDPITVAGGWTAYRMRWKRRRLRWRGWRALRDLRVGIDRTAAIGPDSVLAICTIRNEAERLGPFLRHYRALGVGHFLFIDNASEDAGPAMLASQPDVSLWHTNAGYKAARYGMDWVHGLLGRYGHARWCAIVDADELLVYPHWPTRPLPALAGWLEARGQRSFAALMLDLYPQGRLGDAPDLVVNDPAAYDPGATLGWFDSANYSFARHPDTNAPMALGGVRARTFFAAQPTRVPTQSKVPFVRWDRRYAFVNSTHALLPAALNRVQAEDGGEMLSGVLLHTKFLPSVIERAAEELHRQQHFAQSRAYRGYYRALMADPVLWCAASTRLKDWRGLETAGLMGRSDWA